MLGEGAEHKIASLQTGPENKADLQAITMISTLG